MVFGKAWVATCADSPVGINGSRREPEAWADLENV